MFKQVMGKKLVLKTTIVGARNWQWFNFSLTGLAYSKPNRLSLNRFGSFQTPTKPTPKLVKHIKTK